MKATYYTILGIDPGIHHTGWSISKYFPHNGVMHITDFGQIEASALAKKEMKDDFKVYSNIVSLVMYEKCMRDLMQIHQPQYVVSEDAFYNPHMPNAFLSLKLCINTIQRLLYSEYQKTLYLIPPMVAKKCIRGTGMADKTAVQEAIFSCPDLLFRSIKKSQIEKMVEHEADSIAINYTFAKMILPDLIMQKQ